jgi:hypothetical protein
VVKLLCVLAALVATALPDHPVIAFMEKTAVPAALEMSATFTIADDHLVLRYRVNNSGPVDAYLLNRLFRTSPEWSLSPDVVYVELDHDAQTVWLSKRLADLPEGVNITAPVAPFVTPVRAGASFTEDVRVPLPVAEYWEYPPPNLGEATRERTYRAVYFTLGYYWRPDGTREETRDIHGTAVVMPHTPPGVRLQFGRLESKTVPLALPVIEHVTGAEVFP